ncbi:MAG: cytochrome-c oxidase, cbb3-type subunit III [Alphaproteobacteria bacterium]|nr:cytochrome-c oxidase, cbb3-type subunit III [Alphaproteobacteria bacterium]
MSRSDKHIDEVSGVETTGHEWDGIRELNNPLPAWWLWVFWVSVAVAIIYWVLLPAWPMVTTNTIGILGSSDRVNVANDMAALEAKRGAMWQQLTSVPLESIESNPALLEFAQKAGGVAFGTNCAGCHGSGAQGAKGYPNLADDVWIWGGKLADIQQTIRFGVRSADPETRQSQMPSFGRDEILTKDQINDVVEFVTTLSGGEANAEAAERGRTVFAEQCTVCHGDDGKGNRELGAPNLTDQEWLYGSDKATLYETVFYARRGVMPAWHERLDDPTIRALAVFVHTRGGGE